MFNARGQKASHAQLPIKIYKNCETLVHGFCQTVNILYNILIDAMMIISAPVLSSLVTQPTLLPPLLLAEHLLNPLTSCLLRSTLAYCPLQPFTSNFFSPPLCPEINTEKDIKKLYKLFSLLFNTKKPFPLSSSFRQRNSCMIMIDLRQLK